MTRKFKNPPINELVIGVYFDAVAAALRSEHIGMFWSRVRNRFPKVDQQPPIVQPSEPGGGMELFEGDSPMPRYWFISGDDTRLIQVQKNAFLYNWRRRHDAYPHYEQLKQEFDDLFTTFRDFVQTEIPGSLSPNRYELTYINLIEPSQYWSGPVDTSRVIPTFALPSAGASLPGASDFNHLTIFQPAADLRLAASIKTGRSKEENPSQLLVIELRATGDVAGTSGNAWFDRAHELIGNSFVSMTASEIQERHWQPVGKPKC